MKSSTRAAAQLTELNKQHPDGNIHVVPKVGKEHYENKNCWCHPTLNYKDAETLKEVWAHKGYEELEQ